MTEPKMPESQIIEISNQEKLAVFKAALPIIQDHDLVVTGSLAQAIHGLVFDGRDTLEPQDFEQVNDLDLIGLALSQKKVDGKCQQISQPGFEVEASASFHNSFYHPDLKELVIKEVELMVDGQKTTIRYTSPEYLLLSFLEQTVTEKTTPEKYRKKILGLQNLPGFSWENFRTLANHEINVRGTMNRDTFEVWRRQHLPEDPDQYDQDFSSVLEWSLADVDSLVDQAELLNKVKTPEDFAAVTYEDVRRVSQLEKFLREVDEANQAS